MVSEAISIELPIRGEWLVEVSPADRVPSHGTDYFGLRYAFDFIQVDSKNPEHPTHDKNPKDYLIKGIPLNSYYCFGKSIYAPFSGKVVTVESNMLDGKKASWLFDQTSALRNSLFFNPKRDEIKTIAGNYVVIKKEAGIYAVFCHIKNNTIEVQVGETVYQGQLIGKVGHTGNSTEPHLHFHLMNSADPKKAQGVPLVFSQYETYKNGKWQHVINDLPVANERIRTPS